MPRLIQFFVVLLLALAVRPVGAFSLLGPLSTAPGGEAWQTVELGYGLDGAIGAPKNLTEEYRWNVPVITYGFDPSFVNYFGTNGVNAIKAAMAVYNSVTNLSDLTQTLDKYPLEDPATGATTTYRDARKVNLTAAALNLTDLKSYAMGALAEALGLASPEQNVWTLRARVQTGTTPPITNYFTIMRNFDPVTLMPSAYVNGSRYTYNTIIEQDNPRANYPLISPADPESALYGFSSVANILDGDLSLFNGGSYYSYLTRDDIGGLRYIYDRANLNWEGFEPNTQIIAPDFSSLVLITNLDLASFSSFTFTNPPAAVLAAFPDLVIVTNSSFLTVETQIVGIALTNARNPWSDPFTSNLVFSPILQTNPVIRYNYTFANVITNYSGPVTVIRTEVSGFEREPWSTPFNPVYRTNVTLRTVNLPSGGILIVPTNVGQYNFTGFAFTNFIGITNITFFTNVIDNGGLRPVQITEITAFTNVIFGVNQFVVQPAPASVLREGVGKLTFQRIGEAIFTGTNFLHTNSYVASYYTNGTLISNRFSIVKTLPDILFGARDIGVIQFVPLIIERNPGFVSNADLNSSIPNQGGPGNIFGPIVISFSKVGPGLFNRRPGVASEASAYQGLGESFIWGSFDGGTNPPVVYPKDISGDNLTLEELDLLLRGGVGGAAP